jgi:hypothetical protein
MEMGFLNEGMGNETINYRGTVNLAYRSIAPPSLLDSETDRTEISKLLFIRSTHLPLTYHE